MKTLDEFMEAALPTITRIVFRGARYLYVFYWLLNAPPKAVEDTLVLAYRLYKLDLVEPKVRPWDWHWHYCIFRAIVKHWREGKHGIPPIWESNPNGGW